MATYGIDIITGLPYLISTDEGTPAGELPSATPSGFVYGTDIVTGEEYINNIDGEVSTMLSFIGTGGTTVTQTDDIITIHSELGGGAGVSLNGIGYVKANGSAITYDNSTFSLDSHLHTGVYQPIGTYLIGTKVDSFNSRTGAVSITKTDVENVLTGSISTHSHNYQPLTTVLSNTTAAFTTAQETKLAGIAVGATNVTNTNQLVNGAGYLTAITSGNVTTALGFTPYNATNPNSYISLSSLGSTVTGLTYTNTTGVFSLTSGYSIPTTAQSANWTTAFNWGNHASAGYSLSTHNHDALYQPIGNYLTSYTETEPLFTASPAYGITAGNITSWNAATAGNLPTDANGNLNIPVTTSTEGIIKQNDLRILHTYGTTNLFLGVNAANFTTTGQQNTMIGYQAGAYLGASSYNTAVGHQALYSNVTNGENAAFGRMSLMYATGSFNSGLGNTSLGGVGFTGSCNVGIGKDAGRTLTSGNHCTYVGYNAGYNVSQLNSAAYSMALGDAAYNTKSYQVVLGAANITETILRGVINIAPRTAPASATAATINIGDIIIDSNFIYVATAVNTWKRAALATW